MNGKQLDYPENKVVFFNISDCLIYRCQCRTDAGDTVERFQYMYTCFLEKLFVRVFSLKSIGSNKEVQTSIDVGTQNLCVYLGSEIAN